jgi:DNA replication protein DnaC
VSTRHATINAAMPCPLCDDTGWKTIEDNGVRRVARCDCWRKTVGQRSLATALIPTRYKNCTLSSFRSYNDSLKRAVANAHRFVDAFPVVDRGLLLLGLAGVGKTHLAVGILKEVVQKTGARALFYGTAELLRAIRGTYDPVARTSELKILRPVMEAELLVLDDLGAERVTDWVEETMNLIVNTRYNERRATIFTSNYLDVPEIDDPNSLLSRIGFRMRSRLHEMCSIVEIDAADYRDSDKPTNATDEDLVTLWKLRPKTLPGRPHRQVKANLRDGKADLKWPGGRAGS